MTTDLFLVQRFVDHPRNEWPLRPGVQTVGRSHRCDIVIFDGTISREHARILLEGECVQVLDLNSRNGTYINGERVESKLASVGSIVQFGRIQCLVANTTMLNALLEEVSTQQFERKELNSQREELSAAEQRVLKWLLDGLSEKEAASKLDLSPHTVHNHVRRIYRTLGVTSRGELLALFVQK